MNIKESNNELLKQLKIGNLKAFDAIYKLYSRRLYGFVYRYVKQKADTEEIVQEVFIKIWRNRFNIHINTSFESYIFTIAHNTMVNLLKKRATEHKYIEYVKSIQKNEETYELIHDIQYEELMHQYRSLLDQLPPRQQEIFQLSREEGLNHKEIAEKLGISRNTVKNHLVTTLSFIKSNLNSSLINSGLYICLFFL